MFNPDSELNSLIRLDDYKQQRSGGYSTAPFSTQYRPEVSDKRFSTQYRSKNGGESFLRSIDLKMGHALASFAT